MRTLSVFATGSDGSPHGHGDCDFGDFDIEVTDEQYKKIKENWSKGKRDLLNMNVEGLADKRDAVVDEALMYVSDPDEYSVSLIIDLDHYDDECDN